MSCYVKYPGATRWTRVSESEAQAAQELMGRLTAQQPEFCDEHQERMPAVKIVESLEAGSGVVDGDTTST